MKGRLAALTMVYNEPFFLPLWIRHYARQVGPENCYVIDHGSDDGSTENLPVTVLPRPRTVRDEYDRVRQVQAEVARLLERYDAVIHADVDEWFLPHPSHAATLADYAPGAPPVVTGFGLELQHLPGEEPPINPARPLGEQRQWVRFAAAMCKPGLVRRVVDWSPGFHSSDAPLVFHHLFLVHLRYVDLAQGLHRLADTRSQHVALPAAHTHQRVSDTEFQVMMENVANLPRSEPATFDIAAPPLRTWADAVRQARSEREADQFKLDLSVHGGELWSLPLAFRTCLT